MVARPASARLYFDEDADGRLAEALRRQGHDIETTAGAGLLEASDEEQLIHAVQEQRVLLTHNIKHFPGLHAKWLQAGQQHPGIVILMGQSTVGLWLRRMETLLKRFPPEELKDRLLFLGAEYDTPRQSV